MEHAARHGGLAGIARATRMDRLNQQQLVFFGVTAVTALLVIGPLAILIITSLTPAPALPLDTLALTLDNFVQAFSTSDAYRLAVNTLWFAAGSVVLGLIIATIIAWIVERTDVPARDIIRISMFAAMALPPLASSFGWILLLNPGNGVINVMLRGLFGQRDEGPFNIYTLGMMIFVMGLSIAPTMFVMLGGVLRNMDPQLEQAGTVSGAHRATILRKITLPLLTPGILSAAIYVLMTAIQSFDTPLAIGLPAGVPVLSTRIYLLSSAEQALPNYGLAASFGVMLLIFAVLLMWGYLRATRVGEKYRVVTGRGYRPRRIQLGRWKMLALAFVGVFFLLKALPFVILLWTSLLPFYQVPSWDALGSLTLAAYFSVMRQSAIVRALTNTLILVIASATLSMVLATLISWFSVRSKARATRWLEVLAFTPHTVPNIVMALALLLLCIRTPLYGTLWLIVLGHVVIYLPFTSRTVTSALMQIHDELEKAATACGATWAGTLRWVLLPLLWPHLLNGWLWVAAHSMRDLTMPLMFMTTSSLVISTALWRLWSVPNIPGTAALSILLVLGLLAIVVPVQVVASRATRTG